MKKILISILVVLSALQLHAQAFPSMKGYWFCKSTSEMFVIQVDADQTIKGRGVLYSNGNGRFVQMQIMTQTTKDVNGEKVYFLKIYDPAKPRKVFDVTSKQSDGRIILEVTSSGARDAIYLFRQLHDLNE
jgi:hypothetical protein